MLVSTLHGVCPSEKIGRYHSLLFKLNTLDYAQRARYLAGVIKAPNGDTREAGNELDTRVSWHCAPLFKW
jgi:hypothetical protein